MSKPNSDGQTEQDSIDSPEDNPAIDERAPGWELPSDENGQPDYEAAINEIGLEHDQIFRIEHEVYRYQGRRGDDALVVPQSKYSDIDEDCLPVAVIWGAYHEGNVGLGRAHTGSGLVKDITNVGGNSEIEIGPDRSRDQIGLLDFKNVPGKGCVGFDYYSGEDLPRLRLYDATAREEPAFDFILPTEEHPEVHMVRDPTSYLLSSLPDELEDRLDLDVENRRSYSPR